MNKKKSKKLTLTAETLRSLNQPDLQQVAGEVETAPRVCTSTCTATHACSGCAPCA
jgi:hypothetical protein